MSESEMLKVQIHQCEITKGEINKEKDDLIHK